MEPETSRGLLFFVLFLIAASLVNRISTFDDRRICLLLLTAWTAFHYSEGLLDLRAVMAMMEISFVVAMGGWSCLQIHLTLAQWACKATRFFSRHTEEEPCLMGQGYCSLSDSKSLADFKSSFEVARLWSKETAETSTDEGSRSDLDESYADEFDDEDDDDLTELAVARCCSEMSPFDDSFMSEAEVQDSDNMSLASFAGVFPVMPVQEVETSEDFVKQILQDAPAEIHESLSRVVEIAMQARGGCAMAVASKAAFSALKTRSQTDYQVVDRTSQWPKGYMTTRLRNSNVHGEEFAEAVREFSEHTDNDRWGPGHEAEGQPKDGFTALVDPTGACLKCAVRLLSLPLAPFRWDSVGTRHLTSLSLCWALRGWSSAVVVRSDAGALHVLLPHPTGVKAVKMACRT